ncbi:MAG: methyltransferase domain-containing protein [Merdibacter sp.]
MRMRRLPWAEEYLDKAEVVVKDPAAMKGRWREIVQGERVHLEIGCGKGDYWNLMAQKQPQDGWIAVEKNVSVAGIAVRKFDTMNNDLNRMRFIWGNAEKLDEWFAEDEIDIIHLNFSDPGRKTA